ncbi:mitochondrial import inner membrane translocase subunit Tim13-like isoform X2 [Mytilus edulis]|uniref:mitochondrial import inner membrane translocase subunit Tim13-like isoform X2 n=1 Tax=Mytilus edulis TaxID=6550 RepID=UPI0039EE6A2D
MRDNPINEGQHHHSVTLKKKISEKCFKKCITKPGTTLDSSEQRCVAMCMDRYMDSWNLVSRTFSNRLQKEAGRLS